MGHYQDRTKRGNKILKKMGREGLMDNQIDFSPDLFDMSVGHLFGDVWARPGLSLRDRQLVTLAANIALARTTGNHSHYHSALHLGITKKELVELIIHVGHYSGWPTIGLAMRQLNKVLAVAAKGKKQKAPKRGQPLAQAWE